MNSNIKLCAYLAIISCIGWGSGFQPRNCMIAAESRSHIGLFYDNLDFTDKHYTVFNLINKKAASKPQIVSQVMVMKVTKVN